jgi:signal transduction histidine kinase
MNNWSIIGQRSSFLAILWGIMGLSVGWAQPTFSVSGHLPTPTVSIAAYTYSYEDLSGDTLPLAIVQKQPFVPYHYTIEDKARLFPHPLIMHWLRFRLQNTHPTDTLRCVFNTGMQANLKIWADGQLIATRGEMIRPYSSPVGQAAQLLVLPPNTGHTYYVRQLDRVRLTNPLPPMLQAEYGHVLVSYMQAGLALPLLASLCFIIVFLFFVSIFAAYQFYLLRDRAFLYYALYAFLGAMPVLVMVNFRFGLGLPLFPMAFGLRAEHFSPVVMLFYGLFVSRLINLWQTAPQLWRVVKGLLWVLAGLGVLMEFQILTGRLLFSNNSIYIYEGLPGWLLVVVLFVAVWRSKTPLRPYLLLGIGGLAVLFFFPSVSTLYFDELLPLRMSLFINYPPFFMALGLGFDALCFALALAYRSRLTELEKEQLQHQYTQQLEVELARRTQEIETQSRLLEQRHLQQAQDVFDRRVAETEMTALRSQMNPHFIFNCLNSIKLYATQNDSEKASDYLSKFSRLIRMVLENSRSERVTLQNELNTLQLYLEMEAMRFKEKLNFQIRVEPGIDAQFLKLPPLLLQPYVENAIWHGLMHQPQGGTVRVTVCQPQDDRIYITITDDGVGRTRAAELKSKSANNRKSFGMKLTSDRIALINQLYQTQTSVTINDLVDANGEAAGTEVVLQIPV